MKIAILDDYLDVALGLTDWQQLGSDADIQVFQKPFSDAQETVSALREFGVIVAMRERTGFLAEICLLYTSPSPRDATLSRMPSSA